MKSPRVAFIGLGAMGEPMAANLVQRGFAVTVVGHRRPEPVARLTALGATASGSARAAVAGRDVVILMLPDSDQVGRVVTGADGILGAMPAGACLVDCSTSDPAHSRAIAESAQQRGIAYVDAPVTRGVQGAKQAKLAFFVGGAPAAVEHDAHAEAEHQQPEPEALLGPHEEPVGEAGGRVRDMLLGNVGDNDIDIFGIPPCPVAPFSMSAMLCDVMLCVL